MEYFVFHDDVYLANYGNVHARSFTVKYLFKAPGHSRLLSHIVMSKASKHITKIFARYIKTAIFFNKTTFAIDRTDL